MAFFYSFDVMTTLITIHHIFLWILVYAAGGTVVFYERFI